MYGWMDVWRDGDAVWTYWQSRKIVYSFMLLRCDADACAVLLLLLLLSSWRMMFRTIVRACACRRVSMCCLLYTKRTQTTTYFCRIFTRMSCHHVCVCVCVCLRVCVVLAGVPVCFAFEKHSAQTTSIVPYIAHHRVLCTHSLTHSLTLAYRPNTHTHAPFGLGTCVHICAACVHFYYRKNKEEKK